MFFTVTMLAAGLGLVATWPFHPETFCDEFVVKTVTTQEWVLAYEPGCEEGWRLYPSETVSGIVFLSVWLGLTVLGMWWVIRRNRRARMA